MKKQNFYIGQTFKDQLPSGVGHWCKWHIAHIEKNNNIYTIVKNQTPTPVKPTTEEEQKIKIRTIRDLYINSIEWRIDRYKDQKELKIDTSDSPETYKKILEYMQYLRDYPQSKEEWWKEEPLDFEAWVNK